MTQPDRDPYGAPTQQRFNTLAIVGFALSFFISIAGVVCCAIALSQINARGERGRGLAIAGLVIGSVSMVLAVLALLG